MTYMQRVLAKFEAPKLRRICAFAVESKEPPAEIQLWLAGDNPTDFGVHKWTSRSVQEVGARYAERGNPLLIDVEHNGAGPNEAGEPPVTAGYARLEMREGVPWLVFDWSTYGAEQIASGQRRFLSPEYDVDPSTNEIVRLYRVSLVADPATYRARILASASQETEPMTIAMILAALRAALSAEDPAVAKESITSLIAELDKLAGGDGGAPPDPAPADPAPAFAAADGNGDDDKDKPKPPIAAAAPGKAPEPKPTPPAVTPPSSGTPAEPKPAPVVTVAAGAHDPAASSALAAQNALRDMLLEKHGDRLAPSIRIWASTQPLAIVKGLVDAAPATKPLPAKITATRGGTHGVPEGNARGLQGAELEEYQKRFGTYQASAPKVPHMDPSRDGRVFPTTPPRELQRVLAASAGKDGGGR